MDRTIETLGQVPLETMFNNINRNVLNGLGWLAQGILGTPTLVTDVTCIAAVPASLNIVVTKGQIFSLQNLDAAPFGSLPADIAHQVVKQGLLVDNLTLAVTPPGTVGFAQNYLIQAAFQEVDAGSLIVPYYNPSAPALAWSGPNGSGTPQFTTRLDKLIVSAKPGVAATAGTQATPAPDAGYVGLYVVTVANGATTITSGNISALTTAPVLAANGQLPLIPTGVQNGTWTYAPDTGAANNLVATFTPAPTAYVAGLDLAVRVGNGITGPTVINVNGLGTRPVVFPGAVAFGLGDFAIGDIIRIRYDGTSFQCQTPISNLTIDTAITKTVHGAGADFADLNLAMQWLSKRRITHNGFVTFALAAGKFFYTSGIPIDHPDGLRVYIKGAPVTAAVPTLYSAYAITGSSGAARASDTSANLTTLRTKFATELAFTGAGIGGAAMEIAARLFGIDAILFSSDGASGDGLKVSGFSTHLAFSATGGNGSGLAFTGFPGAGLNIIGRDAAISGPVISFGNGGSGLLCYGSVSLQSAAGVVHAIGNTGDGIASTQGGNIILQGTIVTAAGGNGANGVNAQSGGTVQLPAGSRLEVNTGYGMIISEGSAFISASGLVINANGNVGILAIRAHVSAPQSTISSNNGGAIGISLIQSEATVNNSGFNSQTTPILAQNGSNANAVSSAVLTGSSPVINTVGNSNSYIAA